MAEPENRWLRERRIVGEEYDSRYDRREAAGEDVHGEANFVMRRSPRSVLDAGCGTGRIARELARRGVEVIGVDIDDDMLAVARRRAPELAWLTADIATVEVGRSFDAVLLAGNVMIYLAPGTEQTTVFNLARHLNEGGVLVAGFQLLAGQLTLARYDAMAKAAGLALLERWSTWDRGTWTPEGSYAVSVHRQTDDIGITRIGKQATA